MKYLGLALRLGFILLLFILLGLWKEMRGATSKPPKPVPDIFHYTNPRTYQLGYVVDLDLVRISGKQWTVLTWKPAYAPLLYTESLLFCDPRATEMFVNLTSEDEIVIVYSRAVEIARVDSPPPSILACHELEYVKKVEK